MNVNLRTTMGLIAAAAAFAAGAALAYGDEPHSAIRVDYAKADEKPFGVAADPRKAKRTMRIEMSDAMRFTPAAITVSARARRDRPHHRFTLSGKRRHYLSREVGDEVQYGSHW